MEGQMREMNKGTLGPNAPPPDDRTPNQKRHDFVVAQKRARLDAQWQLGEDNERKAKKEAERDRKKNKKDRESAPPFSTPQSRQEFRDSVNKYGRYVPSNELVSEEVYQRLVKAQEDAAAAEERAGQAYDRQTDILIEQRDLLKQIKAKASGMGD
jgi:hypothetical protein